MNRAAKPVGIRSCQWCGASLAQTALVCMACGNDTRTNTTGGRAFDWYADWESASSNPYRGPTAGGIDAAAMATWLRVLVRPFSLRGRVSRKYWWFMQGGLFAMEVAVGCTIEDSDVEQFLFWLVVFLLLVCWITFATNVKRWHDLNRSGWWTLVNIVPLVGPLYTLIVQGFHRGTVGPNDYGPDPLSPRIE